MIASMIDAARYARTAQTIPSKPTSTPADVLPAADEGSDTAPQGIPVSSLKKIDLSGVKIISAAAEENSALRDQMATVWLQMQAAASRTDVPDNAPQNTYATIKVGGKVVATLYNGGSVAMTNEAAAAAGNLQDPPGLGGPDLAQHRAEYLAKVTGGTIEKASTAISQSQWTPRHSVTPNYTRAQLDAAYQAMTATGRNALVATA